MDYGDLPEEPDEIVHYVREINVYDSAEDVKEVQFVGDSTTVSVGITDDVMIEFVDVAEYVFQWIHQDMAEMDAILSGAENEDELRERFDVPEPGPDVDTEDEAENEDTDEEDA